MAETLSSGIHIMHALRDLLHMPLTGHLTENNSAAIILAKRERFNFGKWRTWAFASRCSWVRDQLQYEQVDLTHTPAEVLIADMLTKILPKTRLQQLNLLAGIHQES